MAYGWMLLALFLGLAAGLLLPPLWRRQEQKVARDSQYTQEQILTEWLYGDKK